jgi:hypothetical protein
MSRRAIKPVSIGIALLALVLTGQAVACGDSLYRVGKGVAYRVYTAPLPGNVLVYGNSEGATELAEALAQSGHNVRQVTNEVELGAEMRSGSYDVVIAHYREHAAVEASAPDVKTTFLPVAVGKAEEREASEHYDKVMLADSDELKHFLKAIHRTLKRNT